MSVYKLHDVLWICILFINDNRVDVSIYAPHHCFFFVKFEAANSIQPLQIDPAPPPHADSVHYEVGPNVNLETERWKDI